MTGLFDGVEEGVTDGLVVAEDGLIIRGVEYGVVVVRTLVGAKGDGVGVWVGLGLGVGVGVEV